MFSFRLLSFGLIAMFAVLLGVRSTQLPDGIARAYPTVLVAAVLLGMLAMTAREVVRRRVPTLMDAEIARLVSAPVQPGWRLLGFVVLWAAYPWLLSHVGFIVATTVTISLSLRVLGNSRIGLAIFGAVLFSFTFAILFTTVFYIPTPSGVVDDWLARVLFLLTNGSP